MLPSNKICGVLCLLFFLYMCNGASLILKPITDRPDIQQKPVRINMPNEVKKVLQIPIVQVFDGSGVTGSMCYVSASVLFF